MAWLSTGTSNTTLINNLLKNKIISSPTSPVYTSMLSTDRQTYYLHPTPAQIKKQSKHYAYGPYADSPQALSHKATLSAPYIQATALESLASHIVKPNSVVLDVGCGSGIMAAYVKRMGAAKVVGIEVVPELCKLSTNNLINDGFEANLNDGSIVIIQGDGRGSSLPHGPYDCIHVGASTPTVPLALIEQLKPGGRMVIPVGDREMQTFRAFDKCSEGDGWEEVDIVKVRFVPLVVTDPNDVMAKPVTPFNNSNSTVDYNSRYKKGWAYGKEPNIFLTEVAQTPSFQTRTNLNLISLGEGQGRNIVYLATLKHNCTGVDTSSIGNVKALKLAEERGVSDRVSVITSDLLTFDFTSANGWDAIVSMFCSFTSVDRRRIHRDAFKSLEIGGIIIIECFAPAHAENTRTGTGNDDVMKWSRSGPTNIDMLVSLSSLISDFGGENIEVVIGREVERELNEGKFHKGLATCTQFYARKVKEIESDVESEVKGEYELFIDQVFDESIAMNEKENITDIELARITANNYTNQSLSKDQLLFSAESSVRMSCKYAIKHAICRYCWSTLCICSSISDIKCKKKLERVQKTKRGKVKEKWVILTHPSEFLRATSTAKIAAQLLDGSEFLVYGGGSRHMTRLDEILDDNVGSCMILFPGPDEESESVAEVLARVKNSVNDALDGNGEEEVKDEEDISILTIIVPDGSWANAQSLVTNVLLPRLKQQPLRYIKLNEAPIASHTSPLIEILHKNSGKGRLSTIEACAFFLAEAERKESSLLCETTSRHLHDGIIPIVDSIRQLNSSTNHSGITNTITPHSKFKKYAEAFMLEAKSDAAISSVPLGLRRCFVCGSVVGTHHRMVGHLCGRRHCDAVASFYLNEIEKNENNENNEDEGKDEDESEDVVASKAKVAFERISSAVLRECIVEPPDYAMAVIHKVGLERAGDF